MPRSLVLLPALVAALTVSRALVAAPPPEFNEVIRALEAASIQHTVIGDDDAALLVRRESERYRDFGGSRSVRLFLRAVQNRGRPWLTVHAYNLYSLADCLHADAARRVLLSTSDKLGTWAKFEYDESDGTVTAWTSIPIPPQGIDSGLVTDTMSEIVRAVDRLDPVLRRAMASGMIDWPEDDCGPQEPTGWLEFTDEDGDAVRVGWATWPDRRAWASTLIAADPLLREFATWNDGEREAFGRSLSIDLEESIARRAFADWLRGARHIKQRHPPVAVRFFAPEGTSVSVTARCPSLALGAAQDTQVVDAMGHVDVKPQLAWNVDALRAINRPTDSTIALEITAGTARADAEAVVEIQPVGATELGLPAILPIAIYVNESHPWVRDIVAEAGRLRVSDAIGCTEDTDYASAVQQVYAIWRTLRARDLTYVSIHDADGTVKGSQAIREFHQSIRDQGANCADGTAAIASVRQAVGFHVHLLEVPNHVLLGVHLADSGHEREWIFLETTAIGDDAVAPGQDSMEEFRSSIPPKYLDGEWDAFQAACAAGSRRSGAALQAGELLVVSMTALREHGLRCIPVAKRDIGEIGPPPDQDVLAARRATARRARELHEAAIRAWGESLPNADPVPYRSIDELSRDVERVGSDPTAIGRLLRSVDGDALELRCLRALASLRDAMIPMAEAALAAFGGPPENAGALLGIPATGMHVEISPVTPDAAALAVRGTDGEARMFLGVRAVEEAPLLDGGVIKRMHEPLAAQAMRSVKMLADDALHDHDGLRRIGTELAERIRAGEFVSHDAVLAEMERVLLERYGRGKPPSP